MADFKKLLDHPEHTSLVNKLMSGEQPKDLAQYLKLKYTKPDEGHLRLSANLLDEFQKDYGATGDFLTKIVRDEKSSVLDSQIAESLLQNKTWKDRIAALADEKIDVNKKLIQLQATLEQRQEQIFDKIQENPGNTKLDYILTKYYELQTNLLEKIDKIINGSPDMRVEHTYTVQMIDEQSVAIQEAIRQVLTRLDPYLASQFMEMLSEELRKLKSPSEAYDRSHEDNVHDTNKLLDKLETLDNKLEDIVGEEENV